MKKDITMETGSKDQLIQKIKWKRTPNNELKSQSDQSTNSPWNAGGIWYLLPHTWETWKHTTIKNIQCNRPRRAMFSNSTHGEKQSTELMVAIAYAQWCHQCVRHLPVASLCIEADRWKNLFWFIMKHTRWQGWHRQQYRQRQICNYEWHILVL